jgi:hypothetical protein
MKFDEHEVEVCPVILRTLTGNVAGISNCRHADFAILQRAKPMLGRSSMSQTAIRGSCLCGAVTYEASPPFQRMIHCHCSRCRKGTGTGHATNLIVAPTQFRWLSGEEGIKRYDLPTAKSFAKWFCGTCGCPVPRLSRASKFMVVPAGSLDAVPPLRPTDHIFWGSRAPWACESGGLPTHDEYPASW